MKASASLPIVIIIGIVFFNSMLFSEDYKSNREHILQGYLHHLSLIQSAQCNFTTKEERLTFHHDWKFKNIPNETKEYLKREILTEETTGERRIVQGALNYSAEEGKILTAIYSAEKKEPSLQGEILSKNELLTYTHRGIPSRIPPSSFFYHIWPGVTLKEILTNPKTKILPQQEKVDNDSCFVLLVSEEDLERILMRPRVGYKIWIAPEKGFLPKKIIVKNSGKDSIVFEIKLEKFDKNIWFPQEINISWPCFAHTPSTTIQYSSIQINQGISDTTFDISFPPGTKVTDYCSGI
ncbi:MAG: hypothetical protein WDA18_08495 [Candidatus Ratteibacteria bacterium]